MLSLRVLTPPVGKGPKAIAWLATLEISVDRAFKKSSYSTFYEIDTANLIHIGGARKSTAFLLV